MKMSAIESSSFPDTPPAMEPELQSSIVEETEKQVWEIIKSIPGLNVTYGSVRCIVYIAKKNEKETKDSAIGAAKGAVQTAALAAGIFAAPVTIPVASGVLTGVAAKCISETAEVIVFFVTNIDEFQGPTGSDEKEKKFYDRIRNVTGVGALYSAIRVPIYLFKRNKQQSIESGVSALENAGGIAVQAGIRSIPNIDGQLERMLEKTTKYALKFFAKKIMAQVSQQSLSLEMGLKEIASVEADLQTIMELANNNSSTTEFDSGAGADLTIDDNDDRKVEKVLSCSNADEGKGKTWSFIPKCFRKNQGSTPKEKVDNNQNESGGHEIGSGVSDDSDVSNSHVLILTE